MSHTPGPWKMLQEEKGQNDLSRRVHGKAPVYRVESANGGHWFIGYFRRKKDARLAAAAPELLEVIREAVDSAEREMAKGRKASPGLATWLEKARAVLAKVRGEESA